MSSPLRHQVFCVYGFNFRQDSLQYFHIQGQTQDHKSQLYISVPAVGVLIVLLKTVTLA